MYRPAPCPYTLHRPVDDVSSGAVMNAFEGAVFENSERSIFAATAGSVFIYDHGSPSPVNPKTQLGRDSEALICASPHPENTVHHNPGIGSPSHLVQRHQQHPIHSSRPPITAFKNARFLNNKDSKHAASEDDIHIEHGIHRALRAAIEGGGEVKGTLVDAQAQAQTKQGRSGTSPRLHITSYPYSQTQTQQEHPDQERTIATNHCQSASQSAPPIAQNASHVPHGPHVQITPHHGSSHVQPTAYIQSTSHRPSIPHTQNTSQPTPPHVQSASHPHSHSPHSHSHSHTDTNTANANPSTDVVAVLPPSPSPTPSLSLSPSPSPSPSPSMSMLRSRSEPAMLRDSLNKLSLNDKADRVLFSLHRDKVAAELYKVVQVEVRYDKQNDHIPYSILTFRLQRGDDSQKQCTGVRLKGKFAHDAWHYPKVQVKNICCAPEDGPASLAEMEVQRTSQTTAEAALGLAGLAPSLKARLARTTSRQTTVLAGQHARAEEVAGAESAFVVNLSVDAAAAEGKGTGTGMGMGMGMGVVDPVMYALLLRLEEHRQPMMLELELEVTYRSKMGSTKTLRKSHTEEYMGLERFDILKV